MSTDCDVHLYLYPPGVCPNWNILLSGIIYLYVRYIKIQATTVYILLRKSHTVDLAITAVIYNRAYPSCGYQID